MKAKSKAPAVQIETVAIDSSGRVTITLAPPATPVAPGSATLHAKGETALAELKLTPEGLLLDRQRKLLADARDLVSKADADAAVARQQVSEALSQGDAPDEGEKALALAIAGSQVARGRIAALAHPIETSEAKVASSWDQMRGKLLQTFRTESASRMESAKAALAGMFDPDVLRDAAEALEQVRFETASMEHAAVLPLSPFPPSKSAPATVPAQTELRPHVENRPAHIELPHCEKCKGRTYVSSSSMRDVPVEVRCYSCAAIVPVPDGHPCRVALFGK